MVPATSSMTGGGPLTFPADETTTDLPVTGLVNVPMKELVAVKLSSAWRKKLSVTTMVTSTGIPQISSEKLSVK